MEKYSFLDEAAAQVASRALGGLANAAKNNSAVKTAAVGAVAGGAINKLRGGSFTKGAAVGAAVGGGAHLAMKNPTVNNAMQNMAQKINKTPAQLPAPQA